MKQIKVIGIFPLTGKETQANFRFYSERQTKCKKAIEELRWASSRGLIHTFKVDFSSVRGHIQT